MIYNIPFKNCDCIDIGKTSGKFYDQISEHKKSSKTQDLHSKIFQLSFNLDHIQDFSYYKILVSDYNMQSKHFFHRAFHMKYTCNIIDETADAPPESVIFLYIFIIYIFLIIN